MKGWKMEFTQNSSQFDKPYEHQNPNLANMLKTVMDTTRARLSTMDEHSLSLPTSYITNNVSTESAQLAATATNEIYNTVDTAITMLERDLISTGCSISPAQKDAARYIAAAVCDPNLYLKELGKLNTAASSRTDNLITIGTESLGVTAIDPQAFSVQLQNIYSGQAIDPTTNTKTRISTEAYDGQQVNNALYFSIAFNLGAARQDEFTETFFPTITIDPLKSGVSVSIEYTTLFKEYVRNISGDMPNINRIPIIKALFDNDVFGTDINALVPVYRENENSDKFLSDLQYTSNRTGTPILTAPLKVNHDAIDYIGICQTDAELSKGKADNTDALDRTIGLDALYYSISNSNGDKEYFKIDTTSHSFRNFTGPAEGHHKDMTMAYRNQNIILNISTEKTAKGELNTIFSDIADKYRNYKLLLKVSINGKVNVEFASLEMDIGNIKVREIRDNSGMIVNPTSAAYTEIMATISSMRLEAYTIEAFLTNSNIRLRGRTVTTESMTHVFNVPIREGITAVYSTQNETGTDNDAGTLAAQVTLAGMMTSVQGVNKLTATADALATAAKDNLLHLLEFSGVAKHLVNPYYKEYNINLTDIVDSLTSKDRDDDITAALTLKIRHAVDVMARDSLYSLAHTVMNNGNMGNKIGVVVGTDPIIHSLLTKNGNELSIGENYKVRVVSTLNPIMKQKIYIVFSSLDESTRHTAPNPLSFGNCFWSPTISFKVTKSTNNAINHELHNNPRFLHVVHCPIMVRMNIIDVQNVFGKVPQNISVISNSGRQTI